MRNALIGVAVLLSLLTGCGKSETTLSLPPNFYPSALAYDAQQARYVVGSFHDAEVAILNRAGKRIGTVRAPTSGDRVLRLAIRERKLWVGLTQSIEVIDLDRPQSPRQVYRLKPPMQYADMAMGAGGFVYLLDVRNRAVLTLDTQRRIAHPFARLPGAEDVRGPLQCGMTGEEGEPPSGALLLAPDGRTLLVALDGRLHNIDLQSAQSTEVLLQTPLSHVTQLLYRGASAGRHEVMAIRGDASRISHLHFDFSMRAVLTQESFRVASSAPLVAAFDGAKVRMMLGSLRHHPVYCGDGRPNTAIRLVEYVPAEAGIGWVIAGHGARINHMD